MSGTVASSFRSLDQSGQAQQASQYLHAVSQLEAARVYKRRTLELLELLPGHSVLDVGCGTGEDVRAIAAMVGLAGEVQGVDLSENLVSEAQQHPDNPMHVGFAAGDATRLRFASDRFDAVRADRMFQHLADPVGGLAELARVCKRGGRVVVSEPDWSTLSLSDAYDEAVFAIRRACCERIPSPRIGSELAAKMALVGVTSLSVSPTTAVFRDLQSADFVLELSAAIEASTLSRTEANDLRERLIAAERRGGFVATLTGFIVAGRKPLRTFG